MISDDIQGFHNTDSMQVEAIVAESSLALMYTADEKIYYSE